MLYQESFLFGIKNVEHTGGVDTDNVKGTSQGDTHKSESKTN